MNTQDIQKKIDNLNKQSMGFRGEHEISFYEGKIAAYENVLEEMNLDPIQQPKYQMGQHIFLFEYSEDKLAILEGIIVSIQMNIRKIKAQRNEYSIKGVASEDRYSTIRGESSLFSTREEAEEKLKEELK